MKENRGLVWHHGGRTRLGLAYEATRRSVPSRPFAEESSPGTHRQEPRGDTAARHDAAAGHSGSLMDEQLHSVCSAAAWGGRQAKRGDQICDMR